MLFVTETNAITVRAGAACLFNKLANNACPSRSIIQACQQETESLQQREGSDEIETQEDLVALQDILYKMELILSLVELLFIDTLPGKSTRGDVVLNSCAHVL